VTCYVAFNIPLQPDDPAARQTAFDLCPQVPVPCIVTITRLSAERLDDIAVVDSLDDIRSGIADRLGVPVGDQRVVWVAAQRAPVHGESGINVEIIGGVEP
jgi:hypothetical protein